MLPSPLHSGESTPFHRRRAAASPPPPMEELWKDINLSLHVPSTPTIHHRPAAAAASNSSVDISPFFLQDFLNGPSSAAALPPPPPPPPPPAAKKRFPDAADNGTPLDRRHKRMIMNRESASRSRARKQAYINELEMNVTRLKQENTWLKNQQQKQILQAQWVNEAPNKHGLQRTTSSPI